MQAAQKVIAAKGPPDLEEIIEKLAQKYPIVAGELARLRPALAADARSRGIDPTPLTVFTLAIAGGALSAPGLHYVHLYSREADLRPEIFRMAIDALRKNPSLRLVLYTRRTRAFQAAANAFNDSSSIQTRFLLLGRSDELAIKQDMGTAPTIILLDLDFLAKTVNLSVITRLLLRSKENRVLLFGNAEHLILREYFESYPKYPQNVAWGINRAQLLNVDKDQNEIAIRALSQLGDGGFLVDQMPEHFHDLAAETFIPSQYRTSPVHASRIWSVLAGAYAIRDAERRLRQHRSIVSVREPACPELEASDAALRQLAESVRGRRDIPVHVASAIHTLWYLQTLATKTTAPLPLYVQVLQKYPAKQFFNPLDELARIEQISSGPVNYNTTILANLRTASLALQTAWRRLLADSADAVTNRTRTLVHALFEGLTSGQKIAVLAVNLPDREATRKFLSRETEKMRVDSGKIVNGSFQVMEPRQLESNQGFSLILCARNPNPRHLEKIATSTVPNVVFVVDEREYANFVYYSFRDTYRERTIFAPDLQKKALERLGIASPFPTCMAVVPEIDKETEALVERIRNERRTQSGAVEFDLRRFVNNLFDSHHSEEGVDTSGSFVEGVASDSPLWRIFFEDETEDMVEEDDRVQVLDLNRNKIELIAPARVKVGQLVVATNETVSGAKFGTAIISLIARFDTKLTNQVALDTHWRQAIRDFKDHRNLKWPALFELTVAKGYSNESWQNLVCYAKRSVWLPAEKKNLRAVLEVLDDFDPGIRKSTDAIWEAGEKLRSIARRVLSHVTRNAVLSVDPALLFAKRAEPEEPDPIVVPELGLRASHIEPIFRVKKVVRIAAPTSPTVNP